MSLEILRKDLYIKAFKGMYIVVRIALYFLLLTTGLFFIFANFFDLSNSESVDTELVLRDRTCDRNEASHFLNNHERIVDSKNSKIVIFGASNGRMGLRPEFIENKVKGFDVSNISFSGGNISEAILALDILKASNQGESFKKNSYAILGVSFGVFIEGKFRFGDVSPLEKEINHYGLFDVNNSEIQHRYSRKIEDIYLASSKPFRCTLKFINYSKKYFKSKFVKTFFWAGKNRVPNRTGQEEVNRWESFYGTKSDLFRYELDKLDEFVSKASSMNMKTLIIDLPMHQYVYENSVHDKVFQKQFRSVLRNNQYDYFNLRHLSKSGIFLDLTHPDGESSRLWSEKVANIILKLESKKVK